MESWLAPDLRMKGKVLLLGTFAIVLLGCQTMEEKAHPTEGVFQMTTNVYKAVGKSAWTTDMAAANAKTLAASHCEKDGKEYVPRNSRASLGSLQDTAVIVFSCYGYDDTSAEANQARLVAAGLSASERVDRQIAAQERQAVASQQAAHAQMMRALTPQQVNIQHSGSINHSIIQP